ncbi:NAD+ synthase [Phosphitispora fastidiosa]|uniref:NAD+ synthase n=1 Tax=Phosphitispora fastidiosa TaxID=2837202 RepID=UPI001E306215|nr:NAD+ synthase [Phosphitispora fastidiosa]MBU7005303.1 NAD+ synthase (glutamine-hydrolyzing) [Phosphitispora fastidiosa]
MKVVIAQVNPIVGDIEGNIRKLTETLGSLDKERPDLIVFPELYLVGYPPRDLLERQWFIERTEQAVVRIKKLSMEYPETGILLGAPTRSSRKTGKALHNSALLICNGETLFSYHKSLLPTYDVFDEARYFEPEFEVETVSFKGEILGISVCEDAWNVQDMWSIRNYGYDPVEELVKKGATLLINISASPFQVGKEELRFRIISNHARRHGVPFLYVNQVGANDELVFDGRSICVDKNGVPVKVLAAFEEELAFVETGISGSPGLYTPLDRTGSIYNALVTGIADYMRKCGFQKAILGLSGGIDSAVVCCLAAAAVGNENVLGISMPSPYSSTGSVEDSRKLAENLGIEFKVIPISGIYSSYLGSFEEHFRDQEPDIAEENIQARIRGSIVMAFSNKFGYLLLSTGNKSEMSVGYCTLYGDMSGGLSPISDVPKTMVYELARYINRERELIPEETITKPPSAELKPDQLDQDTLPAYDILDGILHYYVDEGYGAEDIIKKGYESETVYWVIRNVNRNEYKRKQAAPGLKVTTKAFGIGRRMPIAAKYQS